MPEYPTTSRSARQLKNVLFQALAMTAASVALIVLVQNSLIVIGIPSTWQSVTIGALILLGTGLPAYQAKRAAARAG